ncbi:vitellin-degrading protease [Bombyx mandarina]|uniref:Vitellin-degrading protease n=3 Tax=Bombyx TaxID=7090 RepID=VDP_BOMMO|nr:vitellin-degrading protease precursor [Bombyx mori]XP_028035348.1 vitellin-degrading protease [Bombyx mandarina]Q07943.1 RecName: Full=Vitellin-degrading protease; Contains: RecName: Full=Beta-VTN protease; Contains: RecName: Full=Alpha-VTN protease chain 1; Contains: RecName: Full=Alpha-VTN protease chain 2; Flags: Precursor [Bombyx mori]BAA03757.1 vitellin-degrading protease precursor [Bombyx mori]BAA03758.1 vitellin-degrading protease precursor [Bombyx mori]prf//1802231A vitellin-degradi
MTNSLLICFTILGLAASSPTKPIGDIRIVGGEDIVITEAPYQVSVMFRGAHSCGGTLVAADIVVTAAHCVMSFAPEDYRIRVGSSFHQRDGMLYDVGDLAWHPDFNFASMDNDIAILWLPKPVMFGDTVEAIEMVETNSEIPDGDITIVTGWGHMEEGGGNPSVLQRVIVPKINEAACAEAYSPIYAITPRMLCAGTPEGGKDACQGDSGGPLVHKKKLAGIVSWGLGCARPEYPGVYTKVSALREWVDENITNLRLKHILRRF